MLEYPIVPGRGLVSSSAKELRLDYMKKNGLAVDDIADVKVPILKYIIENYCA